jgi:hypothetical protein
VSTSGHRNETEMTIHGLSEVYEPSGHKQGLYVLERWIFAVQARTSHERPIYIGSRIRQVYAILRLSCMSCMSTYQTSIVIIVGRLNRPSRRGQVYNIFPVQNFLVIGTTLGSSRNHNHYNAMMHKSALRLGSVLHKFSIPRWLRISQPSSVPKNCRSGSESIF